MDKLNTILKINKHLLSEMPNLHFDEVPEDLNSQRRLMRALMNVRQPMPLDKDFLKFQDEILSQETIDKGVVTLNDLDSQSQIIVWQGDITRLAVDAIVNAANSALLGCFAPLHNCIDNAIHSAAGLQLRDACNKIMQAQGHSEPTGHAQITSAFNLPSKFVIHTVGPIIPSNRQPNITEKSLLASCYRSCLECAVSNNLTSIAFCCISTGEFHFPNQLAAEIAIKTVKDFINDNNYNITVVFNTFKDIDNDIYTRLLSPN